ncbi:MAG: XRE family transcriptional regulator [Mesorhizobium sp.]|uniref:helix-turn-helix domain-containing protein n=1 Tax=Mesorhizobium sp. TaxID=1871066 RepID=UPI000FE8680C|nr:helix-turn-helix transcriptional regulator [Mesorhizobium sp.]RWG47940.1 MAG: XRE family transcriptional regulator [Mesorhizobium sp.]TIR02329.1 MAG: helix-turn-helix transcriptional regulator [Mesorhizobium sp.]
MENPERDAMQAQIAEKLEEERQRRKLTNRDFVALIKRFASEKEFSYRTYFLTMRQEQNLTLATVALFARALEISVAELLLPAARLEPWMKRLDLQQIKDNIARSVDGYRKRKNLMKKDVADLIGISVVTYYKIEQAQQNLTLAIIGLIASRLGIPTAALLLGRVPKR